MSVELAHRHDVVDSSPPPPQPFVTVSGVLNRLNQEIQNYLPPSTADATTDAPQRRHGRFELQTRVADGSARPATEQELKSADADTMLQQAAAHVQSLPRWSDKLAWAHTQRLAGNQLYQAQQYQAALDLYLTCLAVAAVECESTSGRSDSPPTNDEHNATLDRLLLFGQVLNNLALCAYQLGWNKKTIHFCTIAIDYYETQSAVGHATPCHESALLGLMGQQSKFHYQRARAHRLRGEYDRARSDLASARQWLEEQNQTPLMSRPDSAPALADSVTGGHATDNKTDAPTDVSETYERCHKTIQREEKLLNQAMIAGARNQKQQQQAMQGWLGGTACHHGGSPQPTHGTNETTAAAAAAASRTTSDRASSRHATPRQNAPRLFSSIRAPNRTTDVKRNDDESHIPLSYWRMYWNRISLQAQQLIDWIDERERDRRKQD